MSQTAVIGKAPPRYILMAQRLIDEITTGQYPIGGFLPTEATLCTQYGVSRHTVREAIREVQALGLVVRQQGVGTKVIAQTPSPERSHMLASVEDLLAFAEGTRLVDVVSEEIVADTTLAASGGFQPGQKLLRLEALRIPGKPQDTKPFAWTEVFVIDAYAGIREQVGQQDGAVGWLIEQRYNVRIAEIQQEVNAIALDEELSRRLDAEPGCPSLKIERRYIGEDGKVFEYAVSIQPADRFSFSMRLTRKLA